MIICFCNLAAESNERRKSFSLVSDSRLNACSEMMCKVALLSRSSVACIGSPSSVQYLFMLLRSRLLAFALTGSVVGSASLIPNLKNPTDAGGEVRSNELE